MGEYEFELEDLPYRTQNDTTIVYQSHCSPDSVTVFTSPVQFRNISIHDVPSNTLPLTPTLLSSVHGTVCFFLLLYFFFPHLYIFYPLIGISYKPSSIRQSSSG